MDWSLANKSGVDQKTASVLRAAKKVAQDKRACVSNSGCVVADFDAALRSGGLIVAAGIHLLCVAAPAALLVEGMGGKATDGTGERNMGKFDSRFICLYLYVCVSNLALFLFSVLFSPCDQTEMGVDDDLVHRTTCFVGGPKEMVEAIETEVENSVHNRTAPMFADSAV